MEIRVDERLAGLTVRDVLQRELGFSSNLIKKLKFSENGILVDGQFVTVRHVLAEGELLRLRTEDRAEDVNKPPDMPAHPSQGHRLDTLANALAWRYRDRIYVFRPVNRLDRDTSGCMLTSNTKDASYKMYAAMTGGLIRKEYLAVLDGIPPAEEGTLRSFMRRKQDSVIEREECAPDAPGAKEAVTEYRVLAESGGRSLVSASPITGRTHQLRVQFASVGAPVTGDSLYGEASPLIARHALHSFRTTFPHPMTGETLCVLAPLPEDLRSLAEDSGLRLPPDLVRPYPFP